MSVERLWDELKWLRILIIRGQHCTWNVRYNSCHSHSIDLWHQICKCKIPFAAFWRRLSLSGQKLSDSSLCYLSNHRDSASRMSRSINIRLPSVERQRARSCCHRYLRCHHYLHGLYNTLHLLALRNGQSWRETEEVLHSQRNFPSVIARWWNSLYSLRTTF